MWRQAMPVFGVEFVIAVANEKYSGSPGIRVSTNKVDDTQCRSEASIDPEQVVHLGSRTALAGRGRALSGYSIVETATRRVFDASMTWTEN